jgi:hypothetical protein
MSTAIPANRPVRLGEQVTDYLSGHTYTVKAMPGDTTCEVCGGLVRNWDCYTLTDPACRRGAERYATRRESAHVFGNGLTGACPEEAQR